MKTRVCFKLIPGLYEKHVCLWWGTTNTSLAIVKCISCRRYGGMQLLLGTWGPPGIWCRSVHSQGSQQTAPRHSPHSAKTHLCPPTHSNIHTSIYILSAYIHITVYSYYFVVTTMSFYFTIWLTRCTATNNNVNKSPVSVTIVLFWNVIWSRPCD